MKKLISTLVALTLVASLAGCSSQPSNSEQQSSSEANASSTASEEPVVLKTMTFLTIGADDDTNPLAEAPLYFELFDEYTKLHPNVTFENTNTTQSFDEKLMAAFTSGNGPDLFWFSPGTLSTYADNGLLQPLDELVAGENGIDYSDVYEGCLMHYKDQFYGWGPVTLAQVLYYNKDHFDEANVEYPTDDWTWDDLMSAAEKLTVKDGDKVTRYGFQCDEYNRLFLSLLWSYGGEPFNDMSNPTEAVYNSPEGIKAATFMKDLVNTNGVAPMPGGQGALGYREAFQNGTSSMMVDVSWTIAGCTSTEGLNYGIALVPKGTERGSWVAPSAWGISTQTKDLDLAWDVWKYINSKDATLKLSYYGKYPAGQVPVWKSALEDPQWEGNEIVDKVIQQLDTARIEPSFSNSNTWYWTNLPSGLQDMIINDRNPQEALDEMCANDNTDFFS